MNNFFISISLLNRCTVVETFSEAVTIDFPAWREIIRPAPPKATAVALAEAKIPGA